MFGKNEIRKLAHDLPGQFLNVQGKPWRTIQGEGPYSGWPAMFIRLWGCHLRCRFCDTDFESDCVATPIADLIRACTGTDLVVLTGGEPMRQNIGPLVTRLQYAHHRVQIETAGSFWFADGFEPYPVPSIVVSPKTPHVHASIAKNATAWKYIMSIDQDRDLNDDLPITDTQGITHLRPLARPPAFTSAEQIFLQPMDEQDELRNKANMTMCINIAMARGYRVSIQQHKILGVP